MIFWHKGVWCVWQTKWHHHPFTEPFFCFKCHHPLVSIMYSDLMVTALWVNFAGHLCTINISSSFNHGIGKWYFTAISLMALLLVHILLVPSFFWVKSVGTAQGLLDSWMYPFCNNSSTSLWSSSCFLGIFRQILYASFRLLLSSVFCWSFGATESFLASRD